MLSRDDWTPTRPAWCRLCLSSCCMLWQGSLDFQLRWLCINWLSRWTCCKSIPFPIRLKGGKKFPHSVFIADCSGYGVDRLFIIYQISIIKTNPWALWATPYAGTFGNVYIWKWHWKLITFFNFRFLFSFLCVELNIFLNNLRLLIFLVDIRLSPRPMCTLSFYGE